MNRILDFLFAPRANCLGCQSPLGAEKQWLCRDCYNRLQPLYLQNRAARDICAFCGEESDLGTCPVCKKRKTRIYRTAAAYEYTPVIKNLVHAFKFAGAGKIGVYMAEEMQKALTSADLPEFDTITWVPLHYTRKWERGYNQSEILARELSRLTGKKTEELLKRVRRTKQQAKLSGEARRKNLDNAFRALKELQGRNILLVDDVRTSGTTAVLCARELERAGAQSVCVVTFACSAKHGSAVKKPSSAAKE